MRGAPSFSDLANTLPGFLDSVSIFSGFLDSHLSVGKGSFRNKKSASYSGCFDIKRGGFLDHISTKYL